MLIDTTADLVQITHICVQNLPECVVKARLSPRNRTYVYKIVSAGGYLKVFWSFVTPTDLMASTPFWLMGCAMICVTVGCYYGYTASGGPTGVGRNTARSMALNVTVVTLSATVFFQMLYGTGVILPIAN